MAVLLDPLAEELGEALQARDRRLVHVVTEPGLRVGSALVGRIGHGEARKQYREQDKSSHG